MRRVPRPGAARARRDVAGVAIAGVAEPVQLPHHDGVAFARECERLGSPGSIDLGATDNVSEQLATAGAKRSRARFAPTSSASRCFVGARALDFSDLDPDTVADLAALVRRYDSTT